MRKMIGLIGLGALLAGCASGGSPGGGFASTSSGTSTSTDVSPNAETWVYFVEPVRGQWAMEEPTEGEAERIQQHHDRLKELTDRGVVLLAGPTTAPPFTGMVIFKADDRAEAEEIMYADPAVKYGVFVSRLAPMKLSLVGDMQH